MGEGELAVPSPLEKILQIRSTCLPGFEWFKKQLIALEEAAYLDKPSEVIQRLKDIVPTFSPVVHPETAMSPLGLDVIDEGVIR